MFSTMEKQLVLRKTIRDAGSWLTGGSMTAVTLCLATLPVSAAAQILTPGITTQNRSAAVRSASSRPGMVENQPQSRAPAMQVENYKANSGGSFRVPGLPQSQPQAALPDFNSRDVIITDALPVLPVRDIRISAPVLLPNVNHRHFRGPDLPLAHQPHQSGLLPGGVYQPQTIAGVADVNGINVLASARFDNTKVNFDPTIAADTITLFTSEAVINWTTNDPGSPGSVVDFLPTGSNLRFTHADSNFTVLNRILTPGFDSAIRINGNVTSDIGGTRGGNIWFYSPGGIIAGSSSFFDVGSLVLTTNDIDTSGGLFGQSGEIRFRGAAPVPGHIVPAVEIKHGARIRAINEGSYLAVVASRVEQDGQVDVNGSVAYVATEQADLTINNGLFDISIPVGSGTTDANGIVHSGTTTGAASSGNREDAQAIYMVAVPKNSALTMLVGGNIGYRPAVSAHVSNGNIILSAGHVVGADKSDNTIPEIAAAPVSAFAANIEFNAGNYTSGVIAATNGALATKNAGILEFANGLSLISANDILLTFDGADQFAVSGDFNIFSAGNVTTNRSAIGRSGFNAPQNTSGMDIVSSGNIVISAVRIDVGNLTANGFIDLDSQLDTNFGVGLAQTGFTVDAGTDVTFVEANTQAGDIIFNADTITGGSIRGGLDNNDAGNDFITVNAAGNIALTGTVGSLDNTTITAGGNLDIATVQNTDAVALSAGGTAVVGALNTTAGQATINGASVTLNNGAIATNLTLNATAGNVVGNDTITLGGFANFDATGDISFGSITAGTGFDIDSTGGNVSFTAANTQAGDITIDAVIGDITGADIRGGLDNNDAGNDFIAVNAGGNIALTGTVGSLDNTTITAGGDLDIATVQNTDAVVLTATGATAVDALNTTAGPATVNGASVTLDNGAIATNLTLNATAGNVTGNGTITLGGFANFDAAGDIGFRSITAGTGFDIDSTNGDISFTAANTRAGDITIDGNNITGGSIRGGLDGNDAGNDFIVVNAAGNVSLTGSVGSLDNTTISAGGTINVATVDTVDAATIAAADAATIGTLNTTGTGSASITGASIKLDNGTIGASLVLNATAGTINVTDTITLGGLANFDATGTISFGTIDAGSGIDIDSTSGDVSFTAANARAGDITIDAVIGDITGADIRGGLDNNDAGNDFIAVNAGGNIALTGTVGSLDNTTIAAGGDLDIATVQNTDAVLLNAGGAAVVDTLNTGLGSAIINGASVTLNNGAIATNLTLNATAGNIAGNGTITLGGFANFDATGDIGFGSITAGTGFDIDINGDVSFVEANTRAGDITIDGNNIMGGSILGGLDGNDAGNDFIAVNAAGNVSLTGSVGSLDNTTITAAGDLNIATVQNTDAVLLNAGGAAVVDTLNTGLGSAIINGASVTLNNGAIATNLTLNATAGNIAGNGTITLGGFANFDATGDIGFGSITAGTGFDIDINGDVSFVEANTRAGDITIDGNNIMGGSILGGLDGNDAGNDFIAVNAAGNVSLTGSVGSLDNTTITAGGTIDGGDYTTPDTLSLSGSNIVIGTATASIVSLSSATNILFNNITSPNAISLTATNGTIGRNTAAGNITSGGAINLNGAATDLGTLDATTVIVTATGAALIDKAISTSATTITGGSVRLNSGSIGTNLTLHATNGDIDGNGQVTVAGIIDLDATGNIGFGDLDAQGGNFTADAGGNIAFNAAMASGNLRFNAGGQITGDAIALDAGAGNVVLTGDHGIQLATITAATADLASSAGDISIDNDLVVSNGVTANGNNVRLRAAGDLGVSATANTGNIDIVAQGDLAAVQATASGSIVLSSLGGSVTAGGAGTLQQVTSSNGSIAISAETDAIIGNLTQASDALIIVAGGLIDIQALASGATITTTSGDMNIASTGQLGEVQNTSAITLSSNGDSVAVLGGTGGTGGYVLDQNEFDRIRSGGDFSFVAASAGSVDPSLVIDDLALNTGQIVGLANGVSLTSADSTRIIGDLHLAGATTSTGLMLTAAAGDIMIATDAGGLVQVTDGNGNFGNAGNLNFIADSIFAMTDQAFADIAGLSVADIDLRLAQNDGIINDGGVIRGGNITLTTTNSSIYIQNTAAGTDFDDRRGITAGSLALFDVVTATPLNIVINGDIGGNTGIGAIAATNISGGFDPASTINGCTIANTASCTAGTPTPTPTPVPTPTPTPTPTPDPAASAPLVTAAGESAIESLVQDISEEEATADQTMDLTMDPTENSIVQIKTNDNLSESSLLDEPVTGAGNDDLWQKSDECSNDTEGDCGTDSGSEVEDEIAPVE